MSILMCVHGALAMDWGLIFVTHLRPGVIRIGLGSTVAMTRIKCRFHTCNNNDVINTNANLQFKQRFIFCD